MTTSNVNYKDLIDLKGDEVLNEMRRRRGTSDPMQFGTPQERADFMAFAQTDPGSPERAEFISAHSNDDEEQSPDNIPVETPPSEAKDPSTESEDTPAEEAAENTDRDTEADPTEEGEEPTEEPSKSELLALLAKKDRDIGNLRATTGKMGRELKEAMTKLETVNNSQSQESDATAPPVMPIIPKPSDFSEGVLDDGYAAAMETYATEMGEYSKAIVDYQPPWAKETLAKVDFTTEHITSEKATEAEKRVQEAWSGVWNSAKEFQTEYGLETSIPAETINSYWDIVYNSSAAQLYTSDQIAAATVFVNNLSDADKANFRKLVPVMNTLYDYSGDLPKRTYKHFGSLLSEHDELTGYTPNQKNVDMTEKERVKALKKVQEAKNNAAGGMSGADIGASDKLLSGADSVEEKTNRLRELSAMRRKNPASFDKTEQYGEYCLLAGELQYGRLKTGTNTRA